jgi:hypothetical protein
METFLGPEMARAKRVPFGPKDGFFGPNWRAIKTTGTLVVFCTRVLLCSVVLCCGVLLCVVVYCCVSKGGGEVSLQLYCARRYSGGGGWYSMYVYYW